MTPQFVAFNTAGMEEEHVGQRIERIAAQNPNLPKKGKLAELFGVRYETMRSWRTGRTAPNRSTQEKIAEVLGVPPEAFMHGAGVPGVAAAAQAERPPLDLRDVMLHASPERRRALVEEIGLAVMEGRRRMTAERFGALLDEVDRLRRGVDSEDHPTLKQ